MRISLTITTFTPVCVRTLQTRVQLHLYLHLTSSRLNLFNGVLTPSSENLYSRVLVRIIYMCYVTSLYSVELILFIKFTVYYIFFESYDRLFSDCFSGDRLNSTVFYYTFQSSLRSIIHVLTQDVNVEKVLCREVVRS